MNKENTLIPELRFPEFTNDKEWKKILLIDTADKEVKWSFTGGPFGSNLKASDYTPEGIRIIQLQNIGDGEFKDNYQIYTSEEKADELLSCNIYAGDIILSKMGDPVGRACIIPDYLERCIMASDGIRLVIDQKKFSKYFIYSLINLKSIRKLIEKKSTGSTRKRIGLDTLKNINLIVPKKFKEQQKIADCLLSLDETIEAYNYKLDLLRDHKKGLIQNLFPQKGEKKPKLRFPEFINDGEWITKTLDKIAEFSKGKGISKADITENGALPCIRYGELYTYYKETIYDVISYTDIPEKDLVLSQANDVIIPSSGETHEDIATSSCVMLAGIALGGDLNIIRSKVNGVFLSYYLNNVKKREISQMAQGISVVHLYSNQLKNLEITFPPKGEQEKIAKFLSGLDEVINELNKRIDYLKLHKKGLMQSLFPQMND
ncbi:restriction endonuclease subunit S [Flavobacterium plurextorum]|uniref:restriction endonuclease subunit S n=1 Tax=Flavobacterium plurextorum TaxID=1114867 RepID=UPI00375774C9